MKRIIFSVLACLLFTSCTRQNDSDERLKNRFSNADAVIIGEFGKIEEYLLLPTAQRADWRVAYIHVKEILQGRLNLLPSGDRSTESGQDWTKIYFPNSRNNRWGYSPKFTPNQKGILALRNVVNTLDLYNYSPDAKTALDFYDFQPLSELENIKKILAVR